MSTSVPVHEMPNSLKVLMQSRAQLEEIEDVATNSLADLGRQGELLKHNQKRVVEVNQNLSFGKKLLNKMNSWFR